MKPGDEFSVRASCYVCRATDCASGSSVVSFQSPPELLLELQLPNRGRVSGMGIPEGVSLIGGGYHGKSRRLSALERGV